MVVAVLVLPGEVARVVYASAPRLFGLLLVFVVAEKDSGMRIVPGRADHDLALFARRNALAIPIDQIDAIVRHR